MSTDLHRVDTLNGVDSHEITLYEYDGRNLVTREVNALGDSTIYVYDGNGNMVSKTDADGYVTQYSYTALDLAKKINYNGAKEASYQYNKVGELVQMNDWTGTNTFELDLLGRLQKMTDHKDNTVSYAYDAVGNQTSITYPDGSKVNNFYDAVYNLTSVIDAEKGTYVYVYLGTTDYLTSAVNSKVISWTSYSEWGEITHNAVLKCGQRELDLVKEYATHDFDAVLNMYYAKARFYDADNRRFAAIDPILDPSQYDLREYVTDPMQLVQYLYVKDNAVNWIDMDGELPLAAIGAFTGMAISAATTAIRTYKEEGKVNLAKVAVSAGEGAVTGALVASPLSKVTVGVVSGVVSAVSSIAQDVIDIRHGKNISATQVISHAVVSGVTSGVIAGVIGGSGARSTTTHNYSKITNQYFGLATTKTISTVPTISQVNRNFVMGIAKSAVTTPLATAVSSYANSKVDNLLISNASNAKKTSSPQPLTPNEVFEVSVQDNILQAQQHHLGYYTELSCN